MSTENIEMSTESTDRTDRTDSAGSTEGAGSAESADGAGSTPGTTGTTPVSTGSAPAVEAEVEAEAGAAARGEAPAVGLASRKPSLWRRSVLWVVAGAVLLGLGAGTAYGITSVSRDRVPGLATRSDGRWDFPELSLPALPSGKPRPFSSSDGPVSDNEGQIHFADLRRLLIPVPAGVTADRSLNGGWSDPDRFLGEYPADLRHSLRDHLTDDGLRHVTARGWTAPDGTSLHVYLAQFPSAGNMLAFLQYQLGPGLTPGIELDGVDASELDQSWPDSILIGGTRTEIFHQIPPYSDSGTHTRMAYVEAGDTLALVVERRRGADAPAVPFHQTVILQQQLLG